MTDEGLETSKPIYDQFHSISHTIKITGSWDSRYRSSIALPDIVWKYLKLESASSGISMQDLILKAVVEQYGLKKSAS